MGFSRERVWAGLEWRARHYQDDPRNGAITVSAGTPDRAGASARLEYSLRSRMCGVSVRLRGEEPVTLSLRVPFAASLYLSLDAPGLDRLLGKLMPADREIDVSVHDHALWWSVFTPCGIWSSISTPRWRKGNWRPLGWRQRQGEPETIEEREVLVPMPERNYRAAAKLTRSRWGFTKLPRAFDEVLMHVEIEMHPGEQLPFPGKGENSWDCGDDATYSMHCGARSIEEGIGVLVGSVLRNRRRHGGDGWQPARAAAE